MSNEFPSKISPIRQIPASEELHHFRISAFSVSALPKWPPFPRPPVSATYFAKATKVKKATTGKPVLS